MGAHLAVSRMKGGARGGARGSAEPFLAPTGLVLGKKLDPIRSKVVHYVSIFIEGGNRPIRTIKGASLTSLNTHHSRLGVVPHCKGDALVRYC